MKKLLLVVLVIIALIISGFALYSKISLRMGNSILGPVGAGSQGIIKRRYEQGKMIRVYFKDGVTDDQALKLLNEWKVLPNINGSSFTSLQISRKPIIDLFVIDIGKKQDVIQIVEQSASVEKISDEKEY